MERSFKAKRTATTSFLRSNPDYRKLNAIINAESKPELLTPKAMKQSPLKSRYKADDITFPASHLHGPSFLCSRVIHDNMLAGGARAGPLVRWRQ